MTEFQTIDMKSISDEAAAALNCFLNIIRLESDPDDPPRPLAEDLQGWRNIPEIAEIPAWLAWDQAGAEIVAMGELEIWNTPDNQHLVSFEVYVHPAYRRRGLGSRMLEVLATEARWRNRRLMMISTNDNVAAGVAFVQHYDFQPGMEARVNQLRLDELDRELLRRWLDIPDETRRRFRLGFFDGPYPDELLPGMIELFQITNDAPRDQLEIEDRQITAEMLRQYEQYQFARGLQRWTMFVVENASGHFCGLTETTWNPNRPSIINQEFTGVTPEFRGHHLGRWMKAAMLDKILRERPQAKVVRTGNADSNTPMLAINQALGFKSYKATTFWQIEVDKLPFEANSPLPGPG
jgi:mycothiol synthase